MNLHTSVAAVLAGSALTFAQEAPAEHVFRQPGLQMDGIARLSDLRGKPVLVEFWGIN